MNQKALNALEYPKIIEKLTEKASSYMGNSSVKTWNHLQIWKRFA